MLKFLAFLFVFGVTQSWACENIRGEYLCDGDIRKVAFEYETRENGVKVLVGKGPTLPLDGRKYNIDGVTYRGVCAPGVLHIEMRNGFFKVSQKYVYRTEKTLEVTAKTLKGTTKLFCRK